MDFEIKKKGIFEAASCLIIHYQTKRSKKYIFLVTVIGDRKK